MWKKLEAGNEVLIECPSRFYCGIVEEKNSVTVVLSEELCIMAHDLGDTGMFLQGRISQSTELTPINGIELNLGSIDSVQTLKPGTLSKLCKRTHNEQGEQQ